jgi:hypothetical protein
LAKELFKSVAVANTSTIFPSDASIGVIPVRNNLPMKKFYLMAIAICGLFLSQGSALALNLDFTLKNTTGRVITALYVSPHSADYWGQNILEDDVENGDTVNVEFPPSAGAHYWDIKAVYSDGSWISFTAGYNLSSIYFVRLGYNDDGQPTIYYTYR